MIGRFILAAIAVSLSGCAALGGGADYTYTHTDSRGSQCSITVGSTRSLQGVQLRIDKNCELTAVADTAAANVELIKLMREVLATVSPVPPVLP